MSEFAIREANGVLTDADLWIDLLDVEERPPADAVKSPSSTAPSSAWVQAVKAARKLRTAGGQGSGNFGHAGRPGEVGGSAPGHGAALLDAPAGVSPEGPSGDSISTPIPRTGTAKVLGQGGINGAKKLTADDGHTYLYKPSSSERWIFSDSIFVNPTAGLAERETLASRVAQEMGFKAPTARIGQVPAELGGPGALMDWVEGADALVLYEPGKDPKVLHPMEEFTTEARAEQVVFDTIIGNVDRHDGNFLVKDKALVPIDHGYSFGKTYPLSQAPWYVFPDDITGNVFQAHALLRNVAAPGLNDTWMSREAQGKLAERIEKINWTRVLRGSHLSEDEREALQLRTARVVQRLKEGKIGKLLDDFHWKLK